MNRIGRIAVPGFLLISMLIFTPVERVSAQGSDLRPRLGLGVNTLLSISDGFGLGFRGRVSAPFNSDLSFAIDVGFTGFFLQGRNDASYVFDPQLSAILTLPYLSERATYLLGGVGAFVPLTDESNAESGPTIHLGIGWVHALTETSLYYEVNPALIVGENSTELVLPFRIGFIF